MPEYLVLLLVQITIFSSVTAVLLLAVKWLFRRRIPPVLSLFLWLILFLRVMLPILPESTLSIYNLIPAGRQIQFSLTYNADADKPVGIDRESQTAENPYQFASDAVNDPAYGEMQEDSAADGALLSERVRNRESLRRYVCLFVLGIFCSGVLVTAAVQSWLYIRSARQVYRQSVLCRDPEILQVYTETAACLRIMDKKAPPLRLGNTSMLAGAFRPFVVLNTEAVSPTDGKTAGSDLRMIFLHELNHFKYGDNWILLLSALICTIFWYNPLLWLVRDFLREDIEVLCDARTLEACGGGEREYARMLCRSSHFPLAPAEAGSAMSVSGRKLKLRLQHIYDRRKRGTLPRIISTVLCIVMTTLCLTNPMVAAESAYTPYIEQVSAMTGRSVRDLTLDDCVSAAEFLEMLDGAAAYAGGRLLQWKLGAVDLDTFVNMADASPFVSGDAMDALRKLTPESELTLENCALLLSCAVGLLGEGRFTYETDVLPEMVSRNTMEALCRNLTEEEESLLLSCYNIGVEGAQASFSYVYTEAMMKLILSRIRNDWYREKLNGYYQKVNLSGDQLDKVNAYLYETVRFVGTDRTFYICDPSLSQVEEETLRMILGAAYAGEREDVYYLKKTEDGCSFADAAALIAKAGMAEEEFYAEYAQLGETGYAYTSLSHFYGEDGVFRIAAAELEMYAARFADTGLIEDLRELLVYHSTGEESASLPLLLMRQYTAVPEKEEECRRLVYRLCHRLNAAAFTVQKHYSIVEITDTMFAGTEEACLLSANLGLIHFGSHPVSVQRQLTSGQCARIVCRLLASMTNAE
ncbi:MAG: M56 family metallopeptidase [Clostridia bacterium]|nr:M56 family metallopeptidase [Clostridia bacterium]